MLKNPFNFLQLSKKSKYCKEIFLYTKTFLKNFDKFLKINFSADLTKKQRKTVNDILNLKFIPKVLGLKKKILELIESIHLSDKDKNKLMYLVSYNTTIPLVKPKGISVDISDRCNLRCRICNQWKDSNKHKKLEFEDIKILIDQISKFCPDAMLEFSGQEPLLKKDLLLRCLEYASRKQLNLALSTNGVLMDEKTAEQFMRLNIHHIALSLDGFKETQDYLRNKKGCFEEVIKGLKLLGGYKKNMGVDTTISITTVINDKNINELLELYDFLKEVQVDSINFNAYILDNSYFFNKKATYENNEFWVSSTRIRDLKEVINKLVALKKEGSKPIITNPITQLRAIPSYFSNRNKFKKEICFAGYNYFHITNFGEITVCGKGPHLNIKDYGIEEIWKHPDFRKTRLAVQNCKKPCLSNCFELI